MSAHLCLMAWNEPIGRPNWTRTFAYSTDMSRTCWAPPTISLARRHRGLVEGLGQRGPSDPGSPSGRAATPSNSSLACLRVWSIVASGVRVSPFASASTMKNAMPSSPAVPAWRATTMSVDAV